MTDPGFRAKLPGFYELRDCIPSVFPDLEKALEDQCCLETFALWDELQGLDPAAWDSIKRKACQYQDLDQWGRGRQQLFDALGEAFAYNYLSKTLRCSELRFIPTTKQRTPDIEGVLGGKRILCEVKTINISDVEIQARSQSLQVRDVKASLSQEFLGKLDATIETAENQMRSYDPKREARHLAYINLCFDDWAGFYHDDYREQINQHLSNKRSQIDVVVRAESSQEGDIGRGSSIGLIA